jgi:hypothetical protein
MESSNSTHSICWLAGLQEVQKVAVYGTGRIDGIVNARCHDNHPANDGRCSSCRRQHGTTADLISTGLPAMLGGLLWQIAPFSGCGHDKCGKPALPLGKHQASQADFRKIRKNGKVTRIPCNATNLYMALLQYAVLSCQRSMFQGVGLPYPFVEGLR